MLLGTLSFATSASAAPKANILRIDPRAGMAGQQPLLTTVVEVVQFSPMSEVVTNAGCGQQKGNPLLDCISEAVEKPNVLWKAFPFSEANARFTVRVDGSDLPAKFDSKAQWSQAGNDPLVGTAWLIALDASSMMGARYEDARQVANQFIGTMGKNDIAKLIIFDDRISPYVANSSWVPAAQKATLVNILNANPSTSPSHQRGRPLFNQIKSITQSFGDIGNSGAIQSVPMHQAMVFLSNGAGREDAGSAAVSAEAMKQYFNNGRFPENNPLAPKTPLPVISIFFPNSGGLTNDLYASNDMQFMQDLANVEIGGFFDIVRTGQGVTKATKILGLVKSRFNQMWVVKWRLGCLATTPEQSFNLFFQNVTPMIGPDGSFKDVPIGVDPTAWPLNINVAQTQAEAAQNPVHPGGTFRVYGDFCWAGDKSRAEAYFVPAGTKPDTNVNRNDPEVAKAAMANLIAQNMRGGALETSETFAVFNVPDEDKIIEGSGETAVTRVVLYDNRAKRGSGVTAETVLSLKAGKKPLNLPIILGAAGIVVVILLLLVVLLRGGGGGKGGKRANQPPPQPVVAGGGAPPYGGGGYGGGGYGGGNQPGGGYGGGNYGSGGGGGGYGASAEEAPAAVYGAAPAPVAQAQAQAPAFAQAAYAPPAPVPPSPVPPPPEPKGGGYPLAVAGGAPVVQVRCPACNMLTMATPGQSAVCFSCGQPLPRDLASAASGAGQASSPEAFPLTGALPSPLEPPPNPYGAVGNPTGATIIGAAGQFAIRAGVEVRVGRDPAQCPITLIEPRVSGVHATLKFEGVQLFVRDENSNNGTYVGGGRIQPAVWTPVASGGTLRFGPVEFSVRID
ncbi:DNA polymerase III subunits gamma and tau [Labilithrix luteola]|uniref:DNA polymerase III subunits gamma and tau n=1 Tax=Labilithrix luteola TaxID=1391654 RepID=A0A0K1QDX9_9BACT|nr:DNA polymerase III subunits gamma and tau [Labilithrix luteola]